MILFALLISGVTTYLLIRYAHLHAHVTTDTMAGPQKFHDYPVSRVGGIGIIAGFAGTVLLMRWFGPGTAAENMAFSTFASLLFVCSLPAVAGGLAEDVTKHIGVGLRLAATMIAAGIAYFVLDGVLDHLDIPGVDRVLGIGMVSLGFTALAVGGVANAINIIDGYNGLAGMIVLFVLAALAYVCHQVGDTMLYGLCVTLIGATAAVLAWNFPRGKIFLGDGGAYFIGFMIGEISVLLVRRHAEVSPWFPFMLVAYPVWETLFSIYRKKVVRGKSPGQPDGLHFHMLVFKRVVRWKVGSRLAADRLQRNSLTSPYLWLLSLTTIVPAVIFWQDTVILSFGGAAFLVMYLWLYKRMITFRVPRWLTLRKGRTAPGHGYAVFGPDLEERLDPSGRNTS